jgi:UDP-N-acetylmuramoylalanine--D-glutamate ligase
MRFSELDGARIGVWGAGREITSFARQLAERLPSSEIAVVAFDAEPPAGALERLGLSGARLVHGADRASALAGCEVIVRSPGVSIHRPELRALREAGVFVTTATALWLAERGGRAVLGVTGTKGKSTTAALAAHLARAAGVPALLAGNIGVPALDLLDEDPARPAIVELSSFQIADLTVGPEAIVVTNLYREHLDWHGSEEQYREDKLRVLGLPGVRCAALNAREPLLAALSAPSVSYFASPSGWDCSADGVSFRGEPRLPAAELPLPGAHNLLNLCAALAGLEALGIEPPALKGALADFAALPHRLETVVVRDGVTWVDDSISTTPESALAALASFPGSALVLIGGGQDRGQDYGGLASALAARGASVIGIPTTGSRLVAAARAAGVPQSAAIDAPDLEQAVALALGQAHGEAVVLLSPAAPSYDHFRDFEQRGERFRELLGAPASGGAHGHSDGAPS